MRIRGGYGRNGGVGSGDEFSDSAVAESGLPTWNTVLNEVRPRWEEIRTQWSYGKSWILFNAYSWINEFLKLMRV